MPKDLIKEKIAIFNKSLKQDFGIGRPRIAIHLNPHAGDDGLLGRKNRNNLSHFAGNEMTKELFVTVRAADGSWVLKITCASTEYWLCTTIRDWLPSKH